MENLGQLQKDWLSKIQGAEDLKALEDLRLKSVGKQGEISALMKQLGQMSPEERKEKGAFFNELRDEVVGALEARYHFLKSQELEKALEQERVDITLPEDPALLGAVHPLSQAMFDAIEIFKDMGFAVAEGPDIETDFYNFTALNVPETHPARQDQDTFYLPSGENGEKMLLRTHTSPVQIRTMQKTPPPLRIIAPGRVYRSDFDRTHTPTFHQIEGLVIEKGIHMGHLKGCLAEFCRRFFKIPDLPLRFRPGYFPFTEPSAEVDIACSREGGQLKADKNGQWLEVLGCGMVHENVLRAGGFNPEEWQGFAFGMGIERMAMIKYGISDLRSFYDSDVRWLRHYGFSAFSSLMGGAAR